MKNQRIFFVALALALAIGLLGTSLTAAGAPQRNPADSSDYLALVGEMTGLVAAYDNGPGCVYDSQHAVYLCPPTVPDILPERDPAAKVQAMHMLATTGLVLIPESTNRRVMAFDPLTGDLVDANFIPADATNLTTPIEVIPNPSGEGFLLSDQIRDTVQMYDFDGAFVGSFFPVNTAIADNIRGIATRPNGNLLVSVGGGANTDSIPEFDSTGSYLGNFIATGSGGLDSPFDVYGRTDIDWLIPGIDSDAVHRYDFATGAYIANLTPINTFPEQVAEAANDNVLVANFSPTAEEGVLEFTAAGAFVGRYDPAPLTGYRGVYELPNGNILTTTGTGVHEIDRSGNLVETKISGVSGRFINYVFAGLTVSHTVSTDGSCGTDTSITVALGTPVGHCITGLNTGQFNLYTHSLDDSIVGSILAGVAYTLTPQAQLTIVFTDTPTTLGSFDYCTTWMAENSAMAISDTACALVEVVVAPEIVLAKTVGLDPNTCAMTDNITIPAGYGGTEVTYCYTMQNTGDVTVTFHTVNDDQLGLLLGPDAVLDVAPGGSYAFTVTALITQTTVNSATWLIRDGQGGSVVASATDTATVTRGDPTDVALSLFGDQARTTGWLPLALALTAVLLGGALLFRWRSVGF
jgi:hypothetical protein